MLGARRSLISCQTSAPSGSVADALPQDEDERRHPSLDLPHRPGVDGELAGRIRFGPDGLPLEVPGRPTTAALAGAAAVIAHRTTIVPHRPLSKLITTGIYRFSRNPMYTGVALRVAGGAFLAGTGWPLVLLLLTVLAVRQLAIKPEETFLGERYGSVYADYRLTVRRWL